MSQAAQQVFVVVTECTLLRETTGMTIRAPPALKRTVPFVPWPEIFCEGRLKVTFAAPEGTGPEDSMYESNCCFFVHGGWLSLVESSSSHSGVTSMVCLPSSWHTAASESFSALDTISCTTHPCLSLAHMVPLGLLVLICLLLSFCCLACVLRPYQL